MKFTNQLTDSSALIEIGARLSRYRLNRNLTQAQLAREAGVSLSTVNRIEAGSSSQLSNLIRVLRVLELLENLESLVPEAPMSPVQQLKLQGRVRQRARPDSEATHKDQAGKPWTWKIPS